MNRPRFTPLAVLFRGRTVSWQFQRAIEAHSVKCFIDGYMLRADPADAIAQYYAGQRATEYVAGGCVRVKQTDHILKVTADELQEIAKVRHIMTEVRLGKTPLDAGVRQIFDILEGK